VAKLSSEVKDLRRVIEHKFIPTSQSTAISEEDVVPELVSGPLDDFDPAMLQRLASKSAQAYVVSVFIQHEWTIWWPRFKVQSVFRDTVIFYSEHETILYCILRLLKICDIHISYFCSMLFCQCRMWSTEYCITPFPAFFSLVLSLPHLLLCLLFRLTQDSESTL